MKKLMLLCAVVLGSLFTISCEGPRGPQGPQGGNEPASVFEYHLNFNQDLNANIAGQIVKHPTKVYFGDALMIFVFEGTDKDKNPIWSPLPIRYFVEDKQAKKDEELEYIYRYGLNDFTIEARATAPLGLFNGTPGPKGEPGYITDMIFRVVYIAGHDPIQKSAAVKQDAPAKPMSYEEVLLKYDLMKSPVKKMY